MTLQLPLHVGKGYRDDVRDANNDCLMFLVGPDRFMDAHFIVEAVNAHAHREQLIRQLITALADVRDREPSAWSALQEHTLDLSREMGF
jgi:hypothetical protein